MSLIEVMVTLTIVGVLLGLAWPSYQSHVRRGHRLQALAALLEAQQFMERWQALQGRYTTDSGAAPGLPQWLQQLPAQGAVRYRLSLTSVDAASYVLKAEPQGAMADDPCGSLTLSSTGVRGRTGTGWSVQQCWQ
jgi:type IV pilus assembly protein PilE